MKENKEMSTIYRYRVWCTIENVFYEVWGDKEPTVCPIDSSHPLQTSATTIIDSRASNVINIREETTSTGGHFKATTLTIAAAPMSTTTETVSFLWPISALGVKFATSVEHKGDVVNMCVGKDVTTGYITTNIDIPQAWSSQQYIAGINVLYLSNVYTCVLDTSTNEDPTNTLYWSRGFTFSVSSTVTENASIGFEIGVSDGTNQNDLGKIIFMDLTTHLLRVTDAPTHAFLTSTPTIVQQTVHVVEDFEIGDPSFYSLGDSNIGGSYVPAGVSVNVSYENKTGSPKTFVGIVEYLY